MKRIAAFTMALCLCTATLAFAWPPTRVSYNPSSGQPIRVIGYGLNGSYSRVIDVRSEYTVRVTGACFALVRTEWQKTFTATYSFGTLVESHDVWSDGVTTVLVEFCL